MCHWVCCVVLLFVRYSLRSQGFFKGGPRSTYPRNGSPAYHLALSLFAKPGVVGSSPFHLTTLLIILIPSFSSLNGHTTTPLTTRGFCPGGQWLCILGRSKIRDTMCVRLSDSGRVLDLTILIPLSFDGPSFDAL